MAFSVGAARVSGRLPVPKWQIALAIGAPVAFGIAIWLYRSRKQPVDLKHVDPTGDESCPVDGAAPELVVRKEDSKPVQKSSVSSQDTVLPDASAQVPTPEPELDPYRQSQLFKTRGNKHFKEGKFSDAIKCYQQAIDVCPDTKAQDISTFYQNKAAAYEQLKNYDAVISDCTRALKCNPKYTKALHRRAKAREMTKQYENCLEDITAVCILEGFQNQSSLIMADRVLKELGKQHASEAMASRSPVIPSKHFVKTFMCSFSEDPVFNLLKDSGDELQGDGGFKAAVNALKQQDYENVVSLCCSEIESGEDSRLKSLATLLRGTFYSLLGDHVRALADFTSLVDDSGADINVRVNALVKRATLRMQLGAPEESLHDLAMAAELGPENADVYHHRGQVYMLLDQVTEAMRDFESAVRYSDSFPIALVQKLYTQYRLAFTQRDAAGIQTAMTAFVEAIEKYPSCPECYLLYAQLLSDQQDFTTADHYFVRAIKADPGNATALVHRGLLQLQSEGNIEKAVKLISEAIQLDTKCEFAYETLGTIEVQRGNLRRAIDLFDKAIPLAKTQIEMAHLFSLKDAALAQLKVAENLGVTLPSP